LRYQKTGDLRFVGHLDWVNLFRRAARRAGLPLHYSLGFHPQPSLAFGPPLPLGYTGLGEWVDLGLDIWRDPRDVVRDLNRVVPSGLNFEAGREVPLSTPSLAERINAGEYLLEWPASPELRAALEARVQAFLAAEAVSGQQWSKHGPQTVDLRRPVACMKPAGDDARGVAYCLWHQTSQPGSAKLPTLLEYFCRDLIDVWHVRVTRLLSGTLQSNGMITIP